MKRFLKFLLVFGFTVISAIVVCGWVISKKLRSENQVLAAELASIKSEQNATLQRDQKDGPGNSKAEKEELLRLRNEVAQLRSRSVELEKLRDQNQRLKENLDSETKNIQARWKSRLSELRTNSMQPADYLGVIPEMAEALTNSDPSIRIEAVRVLQRIGLDRLLNTNLTAPDFADLKKAAIAAAADLLPLLTDPDPLVHANASITLGFLHEDTQEVVPALIADLSSDQARVVGAAAKALGRLQGDARTAWAALLPLTQSSNPDLRQIAVGSLIQIDPVAARSAGFEELP
jgi:HEAT repeat protein